MSISVINLIREIRDKNDAATREMSYRKRLDFIRQKASISRKRLQEISAKSPKN